LQIVEATDRRRERHREAAGEFREHDFAPKPLGFEGWLHKLHNGLSAFEATGVENANEFSLHQRDGHQERRGEPIGMALVAVRGVVRPQGSNFLKDPLCVSVENQMTEFMGASEP